jgi:hypothetical protein
MALQRLNYFDHQFLREQDFKDEQEYHVEARRRHNRYFHSWGVVEGLEVEQHGEHEILIQPGYAVDKEGREIVLAQTVSRDLTSFGHDSEAYVTIAYHEEKKEEDHLSAGGVEGYTRIGEIPEIHEHRKEQLEKDSIVLAHVRMGARGHIEHVDVSPSVRRSAKETTSSVHGWLRVPFKPVRMNTKRFEPNPAAAAGADYVFIVDEAYTFCNEAGARGSMQIPVPPGVTHISGFRVAGSTRAEVIVRLFRTGWNVAEGTGEKTRLLEEIITDGSFHKEVELNTALDESHALAVSIRAEGPAEIWLVAVKFH